MLTVYQYINYNYMLTQRIEWVVWVYFRLYGSRDVITAPLVTYIEWSSGIVYSHKRKDTFTSNYTATNIAYHTQYTAII